MVSGSWRLSVEHCLSNSILRPSAPLGNSRGLMSNIKSVLTIYVALLKTFIPVVTPPPLTRDLHSATRRGVVYIWMTALYNYWLGGQTSALWICSNILELSDTQLQQHISNLHNRQPKMLEVYNDCNHSLCMCFHLFSTKISIHTIQQYHMSLGVFIGVKIMSVNLQYLAKNRLNEWHQWIEADI